MRRLSVFFQRPIAAIRRWRDKLLCDPGFQRRSLRMVFTRSVARRRMRALFDLCSGFVYSQVLLACTRLGLFDILAESPRSVDELARMLSLPRDSMVRLLEAAGSVKLVERRGRAGYGLGPLGAALRGNPAVAMMIEHHSLLYADLADPVALLRGQLKTTDVGRFWPYAASDRPGSLGPDDISAYSDLMAASQEMIADQVLHAYRVEQHKRLMDVGCGSGVFVRAALDRAPHLHAEVFDLPAVAKRARDLLVEGGYGARLRTSGGDFRVDRLPEGADLVTLVRILHDHDDEAVLTILKEIRRAIVPGGTILIAEPMLETRGCEQVAAAYFNFYLLAMGQGRPRSPETLESMLRNTGFTNVKLYPTTAPLLVRVITAHKCEGYGNS